ncbi:MAG: pyridoxamine 5'-phosphate oxidase family protein [Pseudomonadales bacterium]|nr:pyridoxamine 5'-phosphate oxidase family protein [Pseudomonadales bacterium]
MGKLYDALTPDLRAFIEAQKMFFVGTSPLAAEGHVNISPKGMDSLRILDDRTLAYLDVTGSGVETISHIRENGRLVIMFCAFEGSPLILRLHGRGEVLERGSAEFDAHIGKFPALPGIRSIIVLRAFRIADSCGWNVPLYEFSGMRDYYDNYAEKLGEEGMRKGQLASNMKSIDGLPGLTRPSF